MAAVAAEFGVLGSIEARIDDRPVDLGPTRQRLLLAALLVDLGREVTVDQLGEHIWGDGRVQRGTVYGYLSRLRQALTGAKGVEIERRSAGYVVTADPQWVDLHRFRSLVGQARTAEDDERAAALFRQGLELWRGEAVTGVDTPWSATLRNELHQERLAAELNWTDVRLRLGQHAELLASLQTRAGEFPLDERLAGQLMLALYRCGRPAEALEHYRGTRRRLVEELGIDPSPTLQRLHQQILANDASLPSAGAKPGAGAGAAPATLPVPRQLPAPPALFAGRSRELAQLSAALEDQGRPGGAVVISAIGGTGGIGKTYLALRWAHQHVTDFPDGQLYVNLRGFDPSGEPIPPPVAVRGFLAALGVGPAATPADAEDQAALYRSLVAERRMLIVLDDARDTAQVIPLLPGSPACTVLVTSRHQLTSLVATHGAKPLVLDALTDAAARHLLARHLGQARLDAEPDAVTALLQHCAGLPRALSIVVAGATTRPDLPLTVLAEELAKAETRLDPWTPTA